MLNYETHVLADDAQWLVFIHGAGGAIATWKYQTDAFRPYFNLLLLDLRDHGLSKNMVPDYKSYDFAIVSTDILEVVDHLAISKAHFISLSLGSVILQRIDAQRPELIDRMVMAGAIFRATTKMRFLVNAAEKLSDIIPYSWLYWSFSWIILPRRNHRISRRVYRLYARRLTQREYLKWVGLYKDFFKILDSYFHRRLNKLSLIVMGDQDHVFFEAAQNFVERQEQATLAVIEKCGHIVNIEHYERFNSLALEFLLKREQGVVID